jgi:hypothetical protein
VSAIWHWKRPQQFPFVHETVNWAFPQRCVNAACSDVVEPRPHFSICRRNVDGLVELRLQRNEERLAEVTMKSLDLTLRLGTIRCAKGNAQAIVPYEVKKEWVEAMQSLTVCVSLQHDRLGVIAQELLWYTTKVQQSTL